MNFPSLITGFKLRNNIYLALLFRLVLAMFLFSLCRIGFYFYNMSYFPEMTLFPFLKILLGGLRFDLTAVLYINSVIIIMMIIPFDFRFTTFYQSIIKYLFFILNGIALAMNAADFIYYKFTLRRTTADIFAEFEEGPGAGDLLFKFLFDYWHASLFLVSLIILMVLLYNRIKVEGPTLRNKIVYYLFGIAVIPLIIYLFIGGARGGFRHSTRPITLSNAGEYVSNPSEANIVLNTPFSIFRTIGKTQIKKVDYFPTEKEAQSNFNPVHHPSDSVSFTHENVVVIILESFSKEFIGTLNQDKKNYKGYTPFLDSLLQHSLTFQHSFSNGRKSIDGPPSILASIPQLGIPFVLTPYSNNTYISLAKVLRNEGYHTSFFIGHPNGAMGYGAFSQAAGFEHYFGKNEYGNDDDFDGLWGIWDHKFFPFFAKKINEFKQPFFATLYSVTSHHPFVVPKEFEGRFKGGEKPILKCIEYTDHSLKEIFNKVSKEPWYSNTLFVITADHCSSDILFEESHTTWGMYSVPIIFFKPDNSLTGMRKEIIQHVDIMPSILGYLHYNKPYFSFGRDIFREKTTPIAYNFRDTYNLFMDDYLLNFNGQNTVGLYNFSADKLLKTNLKSEKPVVVASMEQKMKAIIQGYNNRMVENKLTAE